MARKRQNSLKSAIMAVTGAMRIEADPTKTAEEKQKAINGAMDIVDNSNVLASAELEDERIANIDQAEAEAEAATERENLLDDAAEEMAEIAENDAGDPDETGEIPEN